MKKGKMDFFFFNTSATGSNHPAGLPISPSVKDREVTGPSPDTYPISRGLGEELEYTFRGGD